MGKQFEDTLFLVASPFQCLCMLEAINYFKIDNYDVIVTYSDSFNLEKVEALLCNYQIPYTFSNTAHIIYGVMPFVFSRHKRYRNFFIGDFNSYNDISIAYFLAKFNANIYFLDDGVQALSLFSPIKKKSRKKFKVNLVLTLYRIIAILKKIKNPVFFTIHNVFSSKYEIVKNPFTLLQSKVVGMPKGVFIIGTNSGVLKFKDSSYEEYLTGIQKQLKKRYPLDKILYCPHRRDPNLSHINSFCHKLNIGIFDTKISVEFDFIENNINPKYIVGFCSNALYTLHMIYPKAVVETLEFSLQSEEDDIENQVLTKRFVDSGISVLNVL